MGRPPKLTLQQQKEARKRCAEGATLKELTQTYNIGRATISRLGLGYHNRDALLLRHRCLVQRHFAYEPTPPKAVDGSRCPNINHRGGTLGWRASFYGSVARENATVGAILLWLLGIPIPIIILLLLL